MKKVKIMLTVITVLAALGGASAFKVNNMRNIRYCISKVNNTCTFTVLSRQGGVIFITATTFPVGVTKYTLANNGTGVKCPQKINLTVE